MNIAEFEQWLDAQIKRHVVSDPSIPGTGERITWPLDGSWAGELRKMLVGAFEAGLAEGRATMGVSALEKLASCVKDGTIQMRDIDRAKVYSEHLGRKLVKGDKED